MVDNYVTDDFNWLKNIVKNNRKSLNILCHHKVLVFCVRMYKMNDSFALFTAETWEKMMLKLEYSGEIWINKKILEKKPDIANIADRT